jgi:hypothetical protein
MRTPRQESERLRDKKRNQLPERKAYKEAWSENHPKNRAKENARYKQLMQSDEAYRMRKRVHRCISTYISVIKKGKKKCVKLIGCDSNELKRHIESQFDGEMTWSNHGTLWTVDHVMPLKFNKPEAYHYTNCRPLRKDQHKTRPLDLSDLAHTKIGILDVRSFHSLE